MKSTLRTLVLAVAASAAALSATPALAASLTIEQQSDVAIYGEWTLVTPSGATVASYRREAKRTLTNAAAGVYSILVTPPDGSTTTIRLLRGTTVIESITGTSFSFALTADTDATIVLAYTYQGSITVESTPSGASFEMWAANGVRMDGVTPKTFHELPPLYYTVNYGLLPDCAIPKPSKRALSANEEVTFVGKYTCGKDLRSSASSSSSRATTSHSSSSRSEQSSSSSSEQQVVMGAARVITFPLQEEVLPGGSVRITTGVVNTSDHDLDLITVIQEFDPSLVSIDEPLPEGGRVDGSTIVWELDGLDEGRRWGTTFTAHINESARIGERTNLAAFIKGDDLLETPYIHLASTATVGIASLPATGWAADTAVAIAFLLLAVPAALGTRRGAVLSAKIR